MTSSSTTQRGFTLFELILSIAVIGAAAGLSVPVFQQLQTRRSMDTEIDQIVALTRRAQTLARSGYFDDDWGIDIDGSTITLFRGSNFPPRDQDFDEVITLTTSTADTPERIVFTRVTGLPDNAPTTVFTAPNGYQLTITINDQGMVQR